MPLSTIFHHLPPPPSGPVLRMPLSTIFHHLPPPPSGPVLRMPLSTIFHHGGAIVGTVFMISFTDEIAEFWFGWISLAYVQFELLLFWGLWLRDYNNRTGHAQRLSETVLIVGWLVYMLGMTLEVVFYVKAVVSLSNRVRPRTPRTIEQALNLHPPPHTHNTLPHRL